MSNSPEASSSAPPSRTAPTPNATADPTTTTAPSVVITLGVTPLRINTRTTGPVRRTNPSFTVCGMTFMAGGK